jgi:hypothetical protein
MHNSTERVCPNPLGTARPQAKDVRRLRTGDGGGELVAVTADGADYRSTPSIPGGLVSLEAAFTLRPPGSLETLSLAGGDTPSPATTTQLPPSE